MAKQVKKENREVVGTGEGMVRYDRFLVIVNREQQRSKTIKGASEAVTKSVQIGEIIKTNILCSPETAAYMNSAQEHQNAGAMGKPYIQWLFPEKTVASGETYEANDIVFDTFVKGLEITSNKIGR